MASTDARWAVRRSAGVRPSGLRALAKPGRTGSARPGSRPALAGLCPGARRAPAGRVGGGGDDVFLLLLAFLFIIPPFGQIFECAYSIRVRLLLHIVQAGDGDGRSRGVRGFVHGRLGPEGGAPGNERNATMTPVPPSPLWWCTTKPTNPPPRLVGAPPYGRSGLGVRLYYGPPGTTGTHNMPPIKA